MIAPQPQLIARATPLIEYLKKQRENERLMKSIEIGSTFLFVSFFAFAAIKPAVTTISALAGEIKSKEIMTVAMKKKINQVIQAQESFASVQERYYIVDSALPDSQRYSQALTQVLGSSQDVQSSIDKISFDVSTKEKDKDDKAKSSVQNYLKSYQITFDSMSDFSSGLKLLSSLETNRRFNQLTNLIISPDKEKGTKDTNYDPNKLIFKYNVNIFYWNK